ncbi:hypothetical protein BRE01_67400 [Brevibacillus reuszeri]|uniref:Uncharacterized protein n=1 Tax=Brevibacillus reuszeri TaxID=54915 RepID=A0A0K9YN69_9BACL|nr:hypothetical protein ADS79_14560 [Brevibacillus reuszeri]GED73038.1 hypothetical protein BRE01_67400 [Brevibacillus reuszeri]
MNNGDHIVKHDSLHAHVALIIDADRKVVMPLTGVHRGKDIQMSSFDGFSVMSQLELKEFMNYYLS